MPDRPRLAAVIVTAALALAGCAAPSATPQDAPVAAEDHASPSPTGAAHVPQLQMETFAGGSASLVDYTGTPVVVNFWASWCPPCVAEMSDLEAVHQLVGDRVAFVGVNTQDVPPQADDLVDATGVSYDLLRDPDAELFQAFGVFGMPSTFYVDADGAIVARHTGLLTRDALLDDIREHLGVDVQARR